MSQWSVVCNWHSTHRSAVLCLKVVVKKTIGTTRGQFLWKCWPLRTQTASTVSSQFSQQYRAEREALSFVLSHLSLIDVGQNGHKPEVLFAGLGEVTGEGWGGEGMGTAAQAVMYHLRYGKFITETRLQFGTKWPFLVRHLVTDLLLLQMSNAFSLSKGTLTMDSSCLPIDMFYVGKKQQ